MLVFHLSICLKVKYDEKLFPNTKEITEQRQVFERKNYPAVINNEVWKALILHNHINNYFFQS